MNAHGPGKTSRHFLFLCSANLRLSWLLTWLLLDPLSVDPATSEGNREHSSSLLDKAEIDEWRILQ